jgi:hypothetical protein
MLKDTYLSFFGLILITSIGCSSEKPVLVKGELP